MQIGLGITITTIRRPLTSTAPSISAQSAKINSETPATYAGWRPLDSFGFAVNLDNTFAPVTVTGTPALVWSIGSFDDGRGNTLYGLKFTGAAPLSGDNGVVLRVRTAGGVLVLVTLATTALGRNIATRSEFVTIHNSISGTNLNGREFIINAGVLLDLAAIAHAVADKFKGATTAWTLRGQSNTDKPTVTGFGTTATTGTVNLGTIQYIRFFRAQNVSQNRIYDAAYVGATPFAMILATNMTIRDCLFESDQVPFGQGGYMIEAMFGLQINSTGPVLVEDCTFQNLSYGLWINGADNVTINRNTFQRFTADAINFQATSNNLTITNNTITDFAGWYSFLHQDAIQGNPSGVTTNFKFMGNVVFPGNSRTLSRLGVGPSAPTITLVAPTTIDQTVYGNGAISMAGFSATMNSIASCAGLTFFFINTGASTTIQSQAGEESGIFPITMATNAQRAIYCNPVTNQWELASVGLRPGIVRMKAAMTLNAAMHAGRALLYDTTAGSITQPLPDGVATNTKINIARWSINANAVTITSGLTLTHYGTVIPQAAITNIRHGLTFTKTAGGWDVTDQLLSYQGLFANPFGALNMQGMQVVGNIIITPSSHGISYQDTTATSIIGYNTVARAMPIDEFGPNGSTPDGRLTEGDGWLNAAAADIIPVGQSPGSAVLNNVVAGVVQATTMLNSDNLVINMGSGDSSNVAKYAAAFAGNSQSDYTFSTSRAATIATLAQRVAGTAIGKGAVGTAADGSDGAWNFVTGTANAPITALITAGPPMQYQPSWWRAFPTGVSGEVTLIKNFETYNSGSAATAAQYSLDGGTTPIAFGTLLRGVTQLTGLTDGVSLPIVIRDVNALGNGPWSAAKNITPNATPNFVQASGGPRFQAVSPTNPYAGKTKLFYELDATPSSTGLIMNINNSLVLALSFQASGQFRLNLQDGGAIQLFANSNTPSNLYTLNVRQLFWFEVDMVAGYFRIYVDGVLVHTYSFTATTKTFGSGIFYMNYFTTGIFAGRVFSIKAWDTHTGNGTVPGSAPLYTVAGNAATVNALTNPLKGLADAT